MKFKSFVVLLFLIGAAGYGQQDAWVYFQDKPDAAFFLSNPLEMLSQRALDRRVSQNIALDEKDVPVHENYISGLQQSAGITVMAVSKWLNAAHVRGEAAQIAALTNLTYVASIDFADNVLDAPGSRLRPEVPTARQQQAQVTYPYGASANQVQMLNGHLLHEQNLTGTGIWIAVLDAGFPGVDSSAPFQRLRDNGLILGGYDFVSGSENFYAGGNHGTVVLSTMGAYVEDQLIGTAPDASYYLFVTEDVTSENPVEESYWAEAAERADSLGVNIITSSLGYRSFDNPAYNYTYAGMDGQTTFVTRAAEVAFSRGMVVVASAGNSGASGDPHIMAPSDGAHVLCIGAVDSAENYAGFSSTGPSADGRIKPDVVAKGSGATVSGVSGTVSTLSGTSFSCPIIAGMVACLWQALPDKTNQQIIDFVRQSADQFAMPDALKGYGVPDFQLALQQALSSPETAIPSVSFYPNPASASIRFTLAEDDSGELHVKNSLGQDVLSEVIGNSPIDIGFLASGIYFYELKTKTGISTGKILKQ
ncbi:MAG: T9SS type A sorting domain-containing protein [Chitinophagaceae bacterium]|nr:MAG: T9SS type A sorting domain-containing protein [Chitinophagaceae bacterium]